MKDIDLNKVDALDLDREETISEYIKKTKSYLENAGFPEPTIIPISAYTGLLARRAMNGEKLSRRQMSKLNFFNEKIKNKEECLVELALVDEKIKQEIKSHCDSLDLSFSKGGNLSKFELERLFLLSGVATLEYSFKVI